MNALRAFTHTLRAIALHVPFSAFFASMSYESRTMLVVLIVLAHTTYEICCLHRDDAGRFFFVNCSSIYNLA